MRRMTEQEKRNQRRDYIRKLMAGPFQVVPWGFRKDLGEAGEVDVDQEWPPERVRCGLCKVNWRSNQGEYMRRHYEKHHGWTWQQAWDGWAARYRLR